MSDYVLQFIIVIAKMTKHRRNLSRMWSNMVLRKSPTLQLHDRYHDFWLLGCGKDDEIKDKNLSVNSSSAGYRPSFLLQPQQSQRQQPSWHQRQEHRKHERSQRDSHHPFYNPLKRSKH